MRLHLGSLVPGTAGSRSRGSLARTMLNFTPAWRTFAESVSRSIASSARA
jgi:hypothetical protein